MDERSDVELLVENVEHDGSYSSADLDFTPCVGCGEAFHAADLDENELCAQCAREVEDVPC